MAMASNTTKTEQIKKEFKSLKDYSSQYPQYTILSFGSLVQEEIVNMLPAAVTTSTAKIILFIVI